MLNENNINDTNNSVISSAVYSGKTRLIDNIEVQGLKFNRY